MYASMSAVINDYMRNGCYIFANITLHLWDHRKEVEEKTESPPVHTNR